MSVLVPGRTLLHPLSLRLPAGRVVGLIGHNGSGKSTLLSVLARQRAPAAGQVSFAGRPLGAWPGRALARQVAFLPQFPPVAPDLLVRELVTLGRYPWHGPLGRVAAHDRAAVEAALQRTGTAALAGRTLGSLSGGERQCACVALCVAQLVGTPPGTGFLLLDEPVSALDPAHQQQVMEVVRALNRQQGTGVVVVLHDVNLAARYCDEIVALGAGRVIAHGIPADIMDADVLGSIYNVRLGLVPDPGRRPARRVPAVRVLRRTVLAAGLLPCAARAAPAMRLACLDYGLAQTVLALGLTPIGLPNPAGYRAWVIDPPLPPGVADLGARTQPNLELLAELRPDAILAVPDHDPVAPALRRIAPTLRLPLQGPDPWNLAVAATRAVGALAGQAAAAEAVVATATARLAATRAGLAGRAMPPLLVVSFLDPRHVAVYGANGIVGAVLDRLGLRNAWTAPTGRWGSATVGLDALAVADTAFLWIIDPLPPDARGALDRSPLWQALPFVRAGRVGMLPPVLMFGALPAAVRLADLLAPRLDAHG